jgi:hypothetical protein
MTTTDLEKPDDKFCRIAVEIKANARWRKLLAGQYADELKALEEIAKHYGGQSWNTGGGIYVAVIPLGPHDAMGVTGECICRYHNASATCTDDIFYEPTNDTSEGMISLVGMTCACGAAMDDGVCSDPACRFKVQK